MQLQYILPTGYLFFFLQDNFYFSTCTNIIPFSSSLFLSINQAPNPNHHLFLNLTKNFGFKYFFFV